MWRYRDQPIQRKISLIIVIGMVCAMVLTVANFISFDRENVKKDLSEEMRVLARITAARSAVALAFGDRSNARENLATLALRSTVQHACIYDHNLHLFADYQRRNSAFGNCESLLSFTPNGVAHFEHELLVVVEPIQRKGKRIGYVLVASDLSPIAERTRKWIVTSFFVTLVALLVAYLMTRRMQVSVVGPIVRLSNLMDQVKQNNDLSLRAEVSSRDEVGKLVDSFNDMLQIIHRHNQDLEMLYKGLVEKSAEAESTAASLEVSNQRIKDLFGSAAHDLRQPLQATSIFVDALDKRITDPEQRDIVLKLKQALSNFGSLFNEILDVSRYEFDLTSEGTKPTSIKSLLSKVFLEFEVMAQEKGLKLRFHTADYKVMAHSALLERIIRNLLSNAIRYTDTGGILLGCRRRGETLAIEVWDTGRGIPKQKQNDIFSKYVQVSAEDREQRGGFGLGLAIVKQFVDGLGYQLTVKSEVGKGTCFRLVVPLAKGARQPVKASPSSGQGQASGELERMTLSDLGEAGDERILLLDDTETIRHALKLTLEGWGFEVDAVESVDAMRTHLAQSPHRPSLMISDFELGGEYNGIDAIAEARKLLGDLPAFIVSGAEQESVWTSIRDAGFQALRKPVKPARLRAMINHLLS